MTTKITGGQRGFLAAARAALGAEGDRMHSPAVHWTDEQGFFVTPSARLVPMRAGEREIWVAGRDANTGGAYCLPDYDEVREMILDVDED